MARDRAVGAACLVFALLLWFVLVPWQVETVGYGWLKPRTLPRILAVAIGLGGLALLLRPDPAPEMRPAAWGRAALFGAVLVAGLAGMAWAGFALAAPVMALAVMLLAGERRPLWLALGVAAMPAAIWLCVAVLLERPLP